MKLISLTAQNCKSLENIKINFSDYTLLVGANNSGKSNLINSIRLLFGDLKVSQSDIPLWLDSNCESYVEATVAFDKDIQDRLGTACSSDGICKLRRIVSTPSSVLKVGKLYAIDENNEVIKEISQNILGNLIYIPASANASEYLKLSGPSTLRNLVALSFENMADRESAFSSLKDSVDKINSEFRENGGVLNSIKESLDNQLEEWGIEVKFSAKQIEESDIIKLMLDVGFADKNSPSKEVGLENHGHGFQRAVIFNLIRLASKSSSANENISRRNILLFEEPEAYLHPSQQVALFRHLQSLSKSGDTQVIITSHSPNFVQKSSHDLRSIARITKIKGRSQLYQIGEAELEDLLSHQSEISRAVNGDGADVEEYTDNFNYHIWLDAERSSLFFANRVLIVEGATERVLLNYLFENDWSDFDSQKLYVLDSLGKYNTSRYMKMLSLFGIPHGVIFDGDEHQSPKKTTVHTSLKRLIEESANEFTLSAPVAVPQCTELYLGLDEPKPGAKKPLNVLVAAQKKSIPQERLQDFRQLVERALGIPDKG